ncbi:hypothetical protein [Roseomonas elaeocarpi]|uniref:Uncharacterized protein n=1 Tax=Roseomonas elaeocarpi TaxID=907779 RepID=A0ABV6K167_9PROT
MTKIPDEFWTTRDILETGVTLILFNESGRVLAEVVGPGDHEYAVMTMPAAVAFALDRCRAAGDLAILDDEDLWQEQWGRLRGEGPKLSTEGA